MKFLSHFQSFIYCKSKCNCVHHENFMTATAIARSPHLLVIIVQLMESNKPQFLSTNDPLHYSLVNNKMAIKWLQYVDKKINTGMWLIISLIWNSAVDGDCCYGVRHSALNFFKTFHDPKLVEILIHSNGLLLGSFESQGDGLHGEWWEKCPFWVIGA